MAGRRNPVVFNVFLSGKDLFYGENILLKIRKNIDE